MPLKPTKLTKLTNDINFSNSTLIKNNIQINILNQINYGSLSKIYDGFYNGLRCVVKISYDNVGINHMEFLNVFNNLIAILMSNEISPQIYSFDSIHEFNDMVHHDDHIKIHISCIEKFDGDLFELNSDLQTVNKVIIETKLLNLFDKLTTLNYIFFDMKPENIIVKLNNDNIITDLKIIDIDPIYCKNCKCIFNICIMTSSLYGVIIRIYTHICHVRSKGILFNSNETINADINTLFKLVQNQNLYGYLFVNLCNLLNM